RNWSVPHLRLGGGDIWYRCGSVYVSHGDLWRHSATSGDAVLIQLEWITRWRAQQFVEMGNRLPQLSLEPAQQPLPIASVTGPQGVGQEHAGGVPQGIPAGADVSVTALERGGGDAVEKLPVAEHGHARISDLATTYTILDRVDRSVDGNR